jgi:pimeloyl-ACP methyl ester carboxylesterase
MAGTTTEPTTEVLHPYPDVPLSVTRVGAGRPILLLHGAFGPDSTGPYFDRFKGSSLILQPTHPGWNGTERPDWFSSFDDVAITYLDLLADEGLSDVTIIAPSIGGWIASEMAIRDRGGQIGRMVIIGALGPHVPGYEVQMPDPVPDTPELAVLHGYAGKSLRDPKMLRRLRRVQVPTLLIWGEHDDVLAPEFGRGWAKAFGRGEFEMIAGAGHRPTFDDPKATFAAIDAFLERA